METHQKIIRNAIQCNLCLDIIESKHRHDFRDCNCGAVFVDGGLDYQRIGGEHWTNLAEYAIVPETVWS